MQKQFTEEDLKELASQLAKPKGAFGEELAYQMHASNASMTLAALDALNINDNASLLELGHGNCGHLLEVFKRARNVCYIGLEISETMQLAAEKQISETVYNKNATFSLYDGLKIPFGDEMFSHVLSVNTLYFWQKPADLLNEIYRVLEAGGCFCLAFADKEFMEKLPFTKYGFELYDDKKVKALVSQTPFEITDILKNTELVKSKTGQLVERVFSVVVLRR